MSDHIPLSVPAVPADFKPSDELTSEQQEKLENVLEHFSNSEYTIPGLEKDAAFTENEKFWLTHDCMLRYLRASKWVLETAIQRLEETLKWRREYGIYDVVTAEHVEPEAKTGKEILFGYDTSRRPAFYMIPSRQNTDEPTQQVQFAVWMLERSIDQMGPGVETIDLLINFADKAKNPSLGTARTVLSILQNHYPERLGLALILNVPWIVNAFFKVITPFIDPVTRNKMKFNPEVVKDGIFTPDQVMKEWWGGDREFIYEHDKYWPELVKMCDERRAVQFDRWRKLGGTIGLKEWDIKGGTPAVEENSKAEPTQAVPEATKDASK